jgi:zinc transporter 1
MLTIDAAFFVLELGVGLIVGSLALMADAFHMVSRIGNIVESKGQTNFGAAE